MLFLSKVALRYLTSNIIQTTLLISGVALSVVVFVFITALINGLALYLTAEVTSKIAHVELEPPNTVSRVLTDNDRFVAAPVSTFRRKQIRNWQQVLELAEKMPGVKTVSPTIDGNAFLTRGEAVLPVAVQGVSPDKIDAMADLSSNLIAGNADLSAGGLLVGVELAEELNLAVGGPVLMRSERGAERLIPITGIFKSGVSSLDRRVAYISIGAARPLFDLPNGVTTISIKLDDPDEAPRVAKALQDATGLKATPWQEKNKTLEEATDAQGRTGVFIQSFAMIAIIISISSALLLSSYRRRAEIGIMRAVGISRRFVAGVFVLQGILIGGISALLGAGLGYQLCVTLASIQGANGRPSLPIAPSEGGYALVITLTIIGAALAAVLPARAAAAVDPVDAIQQ
ncbi:ABC transporter permease [Hyphomonas sp.]|uniref:ABC transporter permease n=1 Tax=Hyphomonas sp. TaxID=87 RepID=UPI0030FCB12C